MESTVKVHYEDEYRIHCKDGTICDAYPVVAMFDANKKFVGLMACEPSTGVAHRIEFEVRK